MVILTFIWRADPPSLAVIGLYLPLSSFRDCITIDDELKGLVQKGASLNFKRAIARKRSSELIHAMAGCCRRHYHPHRVVHLQSAFGTVTDGV